HHVEIARWPAVLAGLTLARKPHTRPGVHARGDLHGQRGLAVHLPAATALRTRIGDDLAYARALVARPGDGEEALGEAHLPRAATRGARPELPALRPGPLAFVAALRARDLDLHLAAERRLLEGDLQVVAEI